LPRLRRDQENDLSLVVDFIEKTVAADLISPGPGLEASQLPDIFPEVRLLAEPRVNENSELFDDLGPARAEVLSEILLELKGLEDPIVTQRSGPSVF
jgi:hypothetical protein